MNTSIRIAIVATAVAASVSTAAVAGQYDRDSGYPRDRDSARGNTDYAQVLSARPLYTEVRINEPRQECIDERVVYRDRGEDEREDYSSADRTIGAVIGGVIGGAIGHQFGNGSSRQIATAIGAVVGADIGRNAVHNSEREASRDYDRGRRERVGYEPRCRTVYNNRYEQRIQGYDVTYRYAGQVYNTQLPYDPGARLPVQVQVSPLRY